VAQAVDLLQRCGYRAWRAPSLKRIEALEVPLSSLRASAGEQQNWVPSHCDATPGQLEAWFRGLVVR
jgi:hypothetical protein